MNADHKKSLNIKHVKGRYILRRLAPDNGESTFFVYHNDGRTRNAVLI